MRWITVLLLTLVLCGCSLASIKHEWIGYFASDVKNSKAKQVQTFNMSGPDCINKIKDELKSMGAIVREDKDSHYICADNFQGVFRSTIDTTHVGILVTWLEADKTQVEVASNNVDLAIFVSEEFAKRLKLKPEKPEEKGI
ncbi:MAG: hypothetical protein HZA72_01485 [Candidatus Omnitrophica bacterium]|nr:hypothetical protein [Candidatus Omnitrophota bacterium]